MTSNQFIAECKTKGVNVKNITFNSGSTVIRYNYDLPGNKISDTLTHTYTYLRPALRAIFDNHFKQADQFVRF